MSADADRPADPTVPAIVTAVDRHPGSLSGACPTCAGTGYWASPAPDAAYTPPSGHTIIRAEVEGIVLDVDVCPNDPVMRNWRSG